MESPKITPEELVDLRTTLFKALFNLAVTSPAEKRNLTLGDMALLTGKTKKVVVAALTSLQDNGFITIDRNRITLNKQ